MFITNAYAAAGKTMSTSMIDLVWDAGPMAKLVLLLLMSASVLCWGIIFSKWRTLKRAHSQNAKFLDLFWHGKNIDEIFSKSDKFPSSPVAAVFRSGVKELKRLSSSEIDAIRTEGVDNVHRALMRASNSEIGALERQVSWLATTASAAPFIGLFGTVWGIMNSFQSIGATGAANLAIVAPGISEALITTAAGIGAAIPAVVAYNHFAGQIKRLATDMDCFTQDFLNIVQRSVTTAGKR
jgi:biopolymer transport protein TolQ